MSLLFRRRPSNVALPTTSASSLSPSLYLNGASDPAGLTSSISSSYSLHHHHHHHLYQQQHQQQQPLRSYVSMPWMHRSHGVVDGSAKNIRLHGDKSLRQVWNDTQQATRITYIMSAIFLLMLYYGVQSLRYSHGQIRLNCSIIDCSLVIVPTGWDAKTSFNFPRQQLTSSFAIKSTQNGTHVSSNPVLYEPLISKKHKRKGQSRTFIDPNANHRGPDRSGHYITFAILLKDPRSSHVHNEEGESQGELVDLSPIQRYLQHNPDADESETDGVQSTESEWLLSFHLFGIGHTKRRVRSMISRIDSYAQKRRQTLTVSEATTPSWVGILCVVLGSLGFFLTVLLGQYVDDKPVHSPRGPGAARRTRELRYSQSSGGGGKSSPSVRPTSSKPRSPSLNDANSQRSMASKYDVKMQPSVTNSQRQY